MEKTNPRGGESPKGHVMALYQRYHRRTYGLAWSILRDEDEALDAVQEAFVKVIRHAERVEGLASPYPWLCRIVTNVCLDRLRKRRVANDAGLDPTLGQRQRQATAIEFEPMRAFDVGQLRSTIADGIRQLSEEHRDVIVMRELEGMSYDAIARRCGCPRGTIMSRLFYARRKLRRILEGTLEMEPVAA